MVVNSPHNPTGTILHGRGHSRVEGKSCGARLLHAASATRFTNTSALRGAGSHHSLLRDPELAERSFVISSFGKTYHATGWKIGYCIAPAALTQEFRRIHQFLTFSSTTPIQMAYADFMQQKNIYSDLPDFYQQKRDAFLSFTEGLPAPPAHLPRNLLSDARLLGRLERI